MKHIHMTLAALSILLFCYRFILVMLSNDKINQKWLKITPHVVDTLLLAVGIGLAVQLSINPIEQHWFMEKLFAVVAYIFTGYYTLKMAKTRTLRIIGFLGTLGWVMLILRLVISKSPLFFS